MRTRGRRKGEEKREGKKRERRGGIVWIPFLSSLPGDLLYLRTSRREKKGSSRGVRRNIYTFRRVRSFHYVSTEEGEGKKGKREEEGRKSVFGSSSSLLLTPRKRVASSTCSIDWKWEKRRGGEPSRPTVKYRSGGGGIQSSYSRRRRLSEGEGGEEEGREKANGSVTRVSEAGVCRWNSRILLRLVAAPSMPKGRRREERRNERESRVVFVLLSLIFLSI